MDEKIKVGGQLTGCEIAAEGIVYNYDPEKGLQQQGIDVQVEAVHSLFGVGVVALEGTHIPERYPVKPDAEGSFRLDPGYYEIDLMEGVDVPKNRTLHFKTRSSLVRCGAQVFSGQFDAGFHTEKAGCFLHVIRPIVIEKGARIAQAIVFASNDVDNTYDGQFQGDKQRT